MQHLQPNTTLQGGKYRIERVLGQGGFGITYVGYNTEFEETVAIKEFFMKGVTEREETTCAVSVSNSDNVSQFEEQREKFKKEARRLRKLKNEHIVKVHDLFEENGTAYYVMDYIDGESLSEKMRRTGNAFTEIEVKEILTQILDALKEVHHNNIWHLDLKPGNVMIDKSGKSYLIDFGASKQIRANGKLTTSTALCYTPGYAPNEQIGQMYDRFGPWTDIYALGATIYNLLTMHQPPMSIDIEEDEMDAFSFPSTVSENMKELVLWMMQPQRKARPQSVEDIFIKLNFLNSSNQNENIETNLSCVETLSSNPNSIEQEETLITGSVDLGNQEVQSVDLGLSVLWANCNVGGTPNSPIGGLYGWGDPSGKNMSQRIKDYVPLKEYLTWRIRDDIGGSENDIATVQWGTGWRMPSREHWNELISECKWTQTKRYNKEGYQVTGPSGNSIFLPFTGIREGNEIVANNTGCYWTSEMVEYDRSFAYYYYFDNIKNNDLVCTRQNVCLGLAVRPIYIKEE